MGFSRQAYWSGFPFPSPGDLPDPRIKLESPTMAGEFFTAEPAGKPSVIIMIIMIIIGYHFILAPFFGTFMRGSLFPH